jgi:predicted DNA binding CopG/RHH family protein
MAAKKIAIGAKPQAKTTQEASKDEWVKNRTTEETTKMKRLTIDVSEDLHRRIKSGCAVRGVKMADEIRVLLEQHFE